MAVPGWPSPDLPPFAELFKVDMELAWRDYHLAGGRAPLSTFSAQAEELLLALQEVWAGARSPSTLTPLCLALKISGAPSQDHVRITPTPVVATATELLRLCTDVEPAATADALDLILGPWADEIRLPEDRRLVEICLGLRAFMPSEDSDQEPWRRWSSHKPVPSPTQRSAVRSIKQAPQGLWRLVARQGEAWVVEDLIGLAAPHRPERARFRPPGRLPGSDQRLQPGSWVFARMVPTPQGWLGVCPILLPQGTERPAAWDTWIQLIRVEGRLRTRQASLETILRDRGHALIRRMLESVWLHP